MKKWIAALLMLLLVLSCFSAQAEEKYSRNVYDYFDTVTTIMGYTDSQEHFDQVCDGAITLMTHYHKLFDGYHGYGDMHNLWYLNRHAASAPVKVDDAMFSLLSRCKEMQAVHEKVNIAMGSVLILWHNARDTGTLPDADMLSAAAQHTDFSCVVLDPENKTVVFREQV